MKPEGSALLAGSKSILIGKHNTLVIVLLVTLIGFSVTSVKANERLPRLVSTSVCTDQFVLMLAAPEQIVGLSVHATNPDISPLADRARQFPGIGDSVEEIMATGADMVVLETWSNHRKSSFLTRMGFQTVNLETANSYADIKDVTRRFAATIGRSNAAEKLVSQMARAEAEARKTHTSQKPEAVYFLPTGSAPGTNTFVHDLLALAGFENYAARQGISGWQHINLETLLRDPPDVFILSFTDRFSRSARTGFAKHPKYRQLLTTFPNITIKSSDWICAGPFVTSALQTLVRGRMEKTLTLSSERSVEP